MGIHPQQAVQLSVDAFLPGQLQGWQLESEIHPQAAQAVAAGPAGATRTCLDRNLDSGHTLYIDTNLADMAALSAVYEDKGGAFTVDNMTTAAVCSSPRRYAV